MPATIASFKIDYYQFLSPDGRLISDDVPSLANDMEKLRALYRLMVTTRIFDKKAVALQRTGKMGTYASSLGQEAASIAIGSAMRPEDCYAPTYRDHGAQYCRGVKMSENLTYWGGDERGSDFSGPRHDFACAIPIATQSLHAAGAALAFKLRDEKRVAVTQVGDGGSSKGDLLETINAASTFDLPLVLVIINNKWAISMPRSKQCSAKTLAQKGIAAGLPSIQVDGNDIIACQWAMENAIEQARAGKGPTIIEMITYRLADHTTADDARRYREDEEVKNAWQIEPVKRLRRYLKAQGAWNDRKELELLKHAAVEVDAAVKEYLSADDPDIEGMFDYLYETMPAEIETQRQRALENQG